MAIVPNDLSRDMIERILRDARTPPFAAPQYVASYRQLQQIKIKLAVDRCVEQIPFRLCHKIQEIRFGPGSVVYPTFEVVYMGGKVVEFENVDSFPTDADIARIALECP